MIEHELLFLGLLREKSMHGYEIKTRIREILSIFAGVNLQSIYYPLKVLEKKGLVVKRSARAGKRPERLVYGLTPKGQARFEELLNKSLLDFKRPQFSLDLSLYFLNYLDSPMAKRRLRARIYILKRISRGLRQLLESLKNKKALSLYYIAEHNLRMLEAEARFLAKFTATLK
jgi:DNA-binding PadR family transcriptional regulator